MNHSRRHVIEVTGTQLGPFALAREDGPARDRGVGFVGCVPVLALTICMLRPTRGGPSTWRIVPSVFLPREVSSRHWRSYPTREVDPDKLETPKRCSE